MEKITLSKRKLVLLFKHFETEHLGKDVFLVPYYLGKIYNLDVQIVYPRTKTNRHFPPQFKGVKLCPKWNPFKNKGHYLREAVHVIYILCNAKKIDVLMRFCIVPMTVIIGLLYKILNPHGLLYVKADGATGLDNKNKYIKNIKEKLYQKFFSLIDFITIETDAGYNALCQNKIFGIDIKHKVRLLSNGFDEEQFREYNINKKSIEEKENIIITVGRLGTRQKNTEMLLNAVRRLYFKNWKLVLIGPIEKKEQNFQKEIENFYDLNPGLKDTVMFTGPIYEKKELWNWYNRAKVFVLTSRWEGFAIVFPEAAYFRNYIISTDVGGSHEMINQSYGEIIPQEDAEYLSKILQNIIDGNNAIEESYKNVSWDTVDISWEKYIREATKNVF